MAVDCELLWREEQECPEVQGRQRVTYYMNIERGLLRVGEHKGRRRMRRRGVEKNTKNQICLKNAIMKPSSL